MKDRYRIVTPENVEFEFEIAGFFSRFLAWFLDILIIIALTFVAYWMSSTLAPLSGLLAMAAFSILYFAINWGYFVVLEWFLGGQSLGKKALGLRVLSDDGVRITFLQSTVRNLFRVLDSIPLAYLVGGVFAFYSGNAKRLGDMAAGTVVIKEFRQALPETIVPPNERYNSFLEDRNVAAKVSSRMTLQERELLVMLALRRERLPLDQRLLLFEELADHLQDRLGMEKPDYFSDEKFCMNITAMLLQAAEGTPALSKHRPRRRL